MSIIITYFDVLCDCHENCMCWKGSVINLIVLNLVYAQLLCVKTSYSIVFVLFSHRTKFRTVRNWLMALILRLTWPFQKNTLIVLIYSYQLLSRTWQHHPPGLYGRPRPAGSDPVAFYSHRSDSSSITAHRSLTRTTSSARFSVYHRASPSDQSSPTTPVA